MISRTINVVIAGLGGQGVIKASDVLSQAAFRAGYDVKKSELHGMSQRGGSVCSDVRFGPQTLSPIVPPGEADFLIVLAPEEIEVNRARLRPGGVMIAPGLVDAASLANRRCLNVALLGALSARLEIPVQPWIAAIRACFPERHHAANEQAFELGRRAVAAPRNGDAKP